MELDFPASTSEAALNSPEDSEYGDAAYCRAALHRPVASPANEAAENTVRASQTGRTVNIAGNAVEASHIVRAAKLAETLAATQIR